MLGEFFGITGVTALMMDMGSARFSKMCAILNNRLDVRRLSKFKMELSYLQNYLSSLKEDYDSPDVRRLMRRAELIAKGSSDKVKQMYDLDIFGKSKEELERLANVVIEEAHAVARQQGAKPQVVNSFKLYNEDSYVRLGDYELSILTNFKHNYLPNVDRYSNMIVEKSAEEALAFGMRVRDIQTKSPKFLYYRVEALFNQPGVNTKALISQCLEWVRIMRSYFVTSDSSPIQEINQVDLVQTFNESFNFLNFLLRQEGKTIAESDYVDLSPERQDLLNKFNTESKPFEDRMLKLIEVSSIDAPTIRTLVETYFELFMLDHDMKYLCNILFPEGSGILLSKEELSGIYDSLNSVGFYCFSFQNSAVFVDSLGKISFNVETRTEIDPDRGRPDYTLRHVLDDIENFCYSLRPMGSKLEEVV